MNHNNIYYIARGLVTVAMALSLLLSLASQGRSYTGEIPLRAETDVLEQKSYEVWERINAARQNPLAAAQRLGIPEHVVRRTFATQEWILDQGLPPLAWSPDLDTSSAGHGRDMFDRLYYSYVSPEGATYWDRIERTGYIPAQAGETMNALFFENFVPIDDAASLIIDAMLRDELTGNPSVERNIFSPEMAEVGVNFFAESIPLLGDQPYCYLLLADFARPHTVQSHVIGTYPEDCSVVMHPLASGGWFQVRNIEDSVPLPGGMFQIPLTRGGADFVIISNNGLGEPVGYTTVDPQTYLQGNNVSITLQRDYPFQDDMEF